MERTIGPVWGTTSTTPMTSARVLIGTIAATGTLAFTTVFAMAPTAATALLVSSLGLPWVVAALIVGAPILHQQRTTQTRPAIAAPPVRVNRSWRLAGAIAAVVVLLSLSLIAQNAGEPADSASETSLADTDAPATIEDSAVPAQSLSAHVAASHSYVD